MHAHTKPLVFYAQPDADGGIVAALFLRQARKQGLPAIARPWSMLPVAHEFLQRRHDEPCRILDFRFYLRQMPDNTSLCALLRVRGERLGLSPECLEDYEEYIDLGDIIGARLYANCSAAYDFFSPTVKLRALFQASHLALNRDLLYSQLVSQIASQPNVEDLFDADPLYHSILRDEQERFLQQEQLYRQNTKRVGSVACANFLHASDSVKLAEFLPFLLCPKAHYGLHLLADRHSSDGATIFCSVNPWNARATQGLHLGHYFAQRLSGQGTALAAQGKIGRHELVKAEELITFLSQSHCQ